MGVHGMDENIEQRVLEKVQSSAIQTYLTYVENSESPRMMHVFSFLTGCSAAMGRRFRLPFNSGYLYPNLYTVLVGPPGARKSSALEVIEARVKAAAPGIRMAPDNTGGGVSGLVTAMMNNQKDAIDEEFSMLSNLNNAGFGASNSLDAIGSMRLPDVEPEDVNSMWICSEELTNLLRRGADEIISYMLKMYDNKAYKYQNGKTKLEITQGQLNMLAATTSQMIQSHMPVETIGQGLTSRIIFVYGAERFKYLWRGASYNPDLALQIDAKLSWLANSKQDFHFDTDVETLLEGYYEEAPKLSDPRFVYYNERRFTHLLKIAMILAALDESEKIKRSHVYDAQMLLSVVEMRMPDAFGEFGLSKESVARQQLLDFLKQSIHPIPETAIRFMMSRHMTARALEEAINAFIDSKKISRMYVDAMQASCLVYVDEDTRTKISVEALISPKKVGAKLTEMQRIKANLTAKKA